MELTESVVHRFWEKVNRGSSAECWEWRGGKTRDGYGKIGLGRKWIGAHRISWMVHNGEVPSGLCVLHRCDNRGCVNPLHLWIGTNADNSLDMVAKGRWGGGAPAGERNGGAKLIEEDVKRIRSAAASGQTFGSIAREYQVSASLISVIVKRKKWKHLP